MHAVLIAKTDVRVYAEMAMRDRLSARVAHLREQVAIAKDEAEDNAVREFGLARVCLGCVRVDNTLAADAVMLSSKPSLPPRSRVAVS